MEDIPTPAQFFALYPQWACDLPRTWERSERVPSFPTQGPLRWRKAMKAANELAEHLRMVRRRWLPAKKAERGAPLPNDAWQLDGIANIVASPVLLRWSHEDWTPRLLDDSYNEIMQDGCMDSDLTAAVCLDPRDAADCRDARARFEALLTTGILTDRLLQLTTTPDKDE